MILYFSIGFIITLIYAFLIIRLATGLKRITSQTIDPKDTPNDISFDVIIVFRNELPHIKDLAQALLRQIEEFPNGRLLLIDDHSKDNPINVFKDFKHPQFKIHILSNDKLGKKQALEEGFKLAQGDFILLTDADTKPNINWVESMLSYGHKNNSDLVLGNVYVNDHWYNSYITEFQWLDQMALMGSTAGAIGLSKAIMSNGANMLIRKKALENLSILDHKFASGDDVNILHAFKEIGATIHFNPSKSAVIEISPKPNLSAFLRQRIRWTSKTKSYKDVFTVLVSLIILITNLFLFILLINAFFETSLITAFLGLYLFKSYVDDILLKHAAKMLHQKVKFYHTLKHQIFYILYVSFVGTLGHFLPTKWKGRKI